MSTSLPPDSFSGHWFTTFGPMDLQQEGGLVRGTYGFNNDCLIEGSIDGERFVFRYQEPAARGEGWFVLLRPGKFEGQWRQEADPLWRPWIGERGFEGVWDSSFGLLRLMVS